MSDAIRTGTSHEGAVRTLTVDRPPGNVLDTVFAAAEIRLGVFAPAATAFLPRGIPTAIAEELYLTQLLELRDGSEGIRAFMEKRAPRCKNC